MIGGVGEGIQKRGNVRQMSGQNVFSLSVIRAVADRVIIRIQVHWGGANKAITLSCEDKLHYIYTSLVDTLIIFLGFR